MKNEPLTRAFPYAHATYETQIYIPEVRNVSGLDLSAVLEYGQLGQALPSVAGGA